MNMLMTHSQKELVQWDEFSGLSFMHAQKKLKCFNKKKTHILRQIINSLINIIAPDPGDNFETVVGENLTPYGIVAMWTVTGLAIVWSGLNLNTKLFKMMMMNSGMSQSFSEYKFK